ncbi:MAG TPA: OmpA family protein [Mycobacteriales bacterium]|nr:OmpA family protein [Mycobacteriales bacterium]
MLRTPTTRPRTPRWLGAALATATAAAGLTVALPTAATAGPSGCADSAVSVTSLNPPVFYRDSASTPALDAGYAGYAVATTAQRADVWVQLSGFSTTAPSPATSVLGLAPTQPSALPLRTLAAGSTTPAFFLLASSGASAYEQDQTVTVYQGRPGTSGASVLCTKTSRFASVDETIKAAANKLQAAFGDSAAVTVQTSAAQIGGIVTVTVDGSTGTIGSGNAGDPRALYMTPTAVSSFPARAFRLVHTSLKISPDGSAPAATTNDILHAGNLGSSSRPYQAVYTFVITGTTGGAATTPWPVQQISSGTQVKHTDTSAFGSTIPAIPAPTNPLTVQVSGDPTVLAASGGTSDVTLTLASSSAITSSIDSLVATLPAGASYVTGSALLNGVSIADPQTAGSTLTWDGPFTTDSSSPQALTFQVTVPGVASDYVVSGYGLDSDNTFGTRGATDGSDIGSVTLTVPAPPQDQTITFPALADTAVTDAAPVLGATASSGLDVTYGTTTPDICTVADGVLTLIATGTCTVTADQAGNGSWNPAPQATQSFQVTLGTQTITFPAMDDVVLTGTAPVPAATASSGLDVSYSTATPSVCSIVGTTVTLLHAGTCTLAADQAGNATWAAAPTVTQSFAVTPAAQTITPTQPSDLLVDGTETLYGSATSGLDVSWSSTTPDVCTVSGTTVTAVAIGTCTVAADQGGNEDWSPAPQVTVSFDVSGKPQTITFPALDDVVLGDDAPALGATATSGLPVSYSSLTPDVCTVDNGVVSIVAAGECTIAADQAGDATTWAAAPTVMRSFTVTAPVVVPPAPTQTITFPVPAPVPGGGVNPQLGATATSGLPVTYTTNTPSVCKVEGSTLVVLGSGTCSLTAHQPGNGVWPAAPPVTISFPVTLPSVGGGQTTVIGTNEGTVPVGGFPPGGTITIPGGNPPGAGNITVSGGVVQVTPEPGFSGVITVPVLVTVGAAQVLTHITVLVLPAPPTHVKVITRNLSSNISWTKSQNAIGYVVRVNGKLVCTTTTKTQCHVVRVLGPKDVITVTALGNAHTQSTPANGRAKVMAPVKLGVVYFDTDSSVLTAGDKAMLHRIAKTMKAHGLHHLWLSGYTDNQAGYAYNLALSARRAKAVASFLQHLLPGAHVDYKLSQHSYLHPVASNTSASGRALNRRTEIAAS